MYWRLEKALIETTIKTFRRVFQYAPPWFNKDLEVVQLASGSGELIYEQYSEVEESYPRITVGGLGGVYSQLAFNDLIMVGDNDTCPMGINTLNWVKVQDPDILEVPISLAALKQTVRGVFTAIAWTGVDFGVDNLNISLYSDYLTAPVLQSSGSVDSTTRRFLFDAYAPFYPEVVLDGKDYWLKYQIASNSSYYIAIDPNAEGVYKFQGNFYSGSVVASLLLPGFTRIGGGFDGTLQVLCQAKNDTFFPRSLAEIVAQYFTYLKHAQISRASVQDSMVLDGGIGEWLTKGIRIKAIREGALQIRKRSDIDNVYSIIVSVDYFTEYFEDFAFPGIKEIDITSITSFWNSINAKVTI